MSGGQDRTRREAGGTGTSAGHETLGTDFTDPSSSRMKPDHWFLLAILGLCLILGALELAYYSTPPKGAFVFHPKQ
jgi:hypothetical protein